MVLVLARSGVTREAVPGTGRPVWVFTVQSTMSDIQLR